MLFISGLGTRCLHPIRDTENIRKRGFCTKELHIFGVSSIKPPVTKERLVVKGA